MCSPMQEPMCLVKNVNGSLSVNEEASKYLSRNNQPVVVVSVVGLYRTGKSYLMNRLAGKSTGFALGNTIESKTKGIWMWCVPHPYQQGHTLVLLDTEGLDDIGKGDSKNDAWIFCLTVLLSSTLVYNSRGTIDNNAVEKLHYVTELSEQIKIKSSSAKEVEEEDEEFQFVQFFPNFIWAVRDFLLVLETEKKGPMTEDEYLDFALQLKTVESLQCKPVPAIICAAITTCCRALQSIAASKPDCDGAGRSTEITNYNLPRQCIRYNFPTRKCFVFPFPAFQNKIVYLESLDENDICPDFLTATQRFCDYVFDVSKVKMVKGGYKVTGKMFGHLVHSYVETISSGNVPCLENVVLAMARIENEEAVQEGIKLYQSRMEQVKSLFPVSFSEIFAENITISNMVNTEFMKRSFKDKNGEYFKKLMMEVDKHYAELSVLNMEASEQKCQQILSDLYKEISERIQNRDFLKPGGYKLYCTHRDNIILQYHSQPNKGIQADEVLAKFLSGKSEEAKLILQTDEQLTESEKKIQEEKEQAAFLQQQCRVEQERKMEVERLLQELKEHHEQMVQQLNTKLEEEKFQQQQEVERAIESKQIEQKKLLIDFEEKAHLMGLEIEQLKKEKEELSHSFYKDYFIQVLSIAKELFLIYIQYKAMTKQISM